MPIEIKTVKTSLLIYYTLRNKVVAELEAKEILRDDIYKFKGIDLISIHTDENHRGKGYASKLLNRLIELCIELGYKYILTDDATDVMPPNNIYYKFGFLVKNDDGKWVKWTSNIEPDEERLLLI